MLLDGDVMTIVQKWGSMPRHARSKRGFASDGQFSARLVRAVFSTRKTDQTRLLHLDKADETAGMKWILIKVGTRIGRA